MTDKMSTRENKFLTTGEDLEKLLARCKTCYNITNNGNYVLFHTKLPNIIIPQKKKIALIINTKDETESEGLGHWFTLVIYKNSKLFLCDGLGQVRNEPNIIKNINLKEL